MTPHSFAQHLKKMGSSIVLGIVGLSLVGASLTAITPSANALTLDLDARDCDANAVIRCGVASTEGLMERYNNDASVRGIFNHFGISPAEMNRMGSSARAGVVHKDGRVTVGNDVVATGAMTAGRQNMGGGTPVSVGGATFYKRPPSASFQTNRLKAFVVMDGNDQFAFAVIASCGNPVTAQPRPRPKPQPRPAPAPTKPTPPPKPKPQPRPQPAPQPAPPPAPAPAPPPEQNQSQNQSQQQSATANANASVTVTQPPAPAPAPAPPAPAPVVEKVEVPTPVAAAQPVAPAPAPVQELPRTGMENVGKMLGLAGLATLAGTIMHILYSRRKLRQS